MTKVERNSNARSIFFLTGEIKIIFLHFLFFVRFFFGCSLAGKKKRRRGGSESFLFPPFLLSRPKLFFLKRQRRESRVRKEGRGIWQPWGREGEEGDPWQWFRRRRKYLFLLSICLYQYAIMVWIFFLDLRFWIKIFWPLKHTWGGSTLIW